jgi:hypothetical protein
MYPPAAYSPDGTLWWRLEHSPNSSRRFGDEQKIAAWLACNLAPGDVFTMRALRAALGEDSLPNNAEHLNRRLRTLRIRDGWRIPSAKDDGSLGHDEYRVDQIGWHPGLGTARPSANVISNMTRRQVFERDKNMCVICGAIAGEPYDDMPDRNARLTIGHRIPGKRLTSKASVDELQAECSRCNETVRDEMFDPRTLPQILPRVRSMSRQEKAQLLEWLEAGRRSRTLGEGELELLVDDLRMMTRE